MVRMDKAARIYVAGHRGLVGSAIERRLRLDGFQNIVGRSHSELDLTDRLAVDDFFANDRIEFVFLAAAKVGGIVANMNNPAEFLYENLAIQTNVIDAAYRSSVKKLQFLASSCIYPRDSAQPMKEGDLLTGSLEPTNEEYALAKIAGIRMCQGYNKQYGTNFISVVPCNIYGPNALFDANDSHVIPSLLRRFHDAKMANEPEVVVWGTGAPRREFLHVDDLAEACVFLMRSYEESEMINIGTGSDVTILELAEMVRDTVGFEGRIALDDTKPDGIPRKLVDVTKLREMGWEASVGLDDGLRQTYVWYESTLESPPQTRGGAN